jgi:hypothetical protein
MFTDAIALVCPQTLFVEESAEADRKFGSASTAEADRFFRIDAVVGSVTHVDFLPWCLTQE